ncbi:MAG: arylamine N-acetyltransferase [Saprospiraceae bacterium]|nr:arylamine N-acetyltransferase [Lewinella sp.]
MENFKLENYLKRIGFNGQAEPNLATLSTIQNLHTRAIPFENLNPFSGIQVNLAPEAIQEKLVDSARGGYCFEQNQLLQFALQKIGYQVSGLAARVIVGQPLDAHSPYTHMMLRVEIDGHTYIADVGFGSMSLTAPLLLEPDLVQITPHGPYRIVRTGSFYRVESSVAGNWQALYKFDLEHHQSADYEMMNWFTSCHPASKFTNTLIAARTFAGGRYTLRNFEFNTHYVDRPSVKNELETPADVSRVLQDIFLLDLTGLEKLEERIEILFEEKVG